MNGKTIPTKLKPSTIDTGQILNGSKELLKTIVTGDDLRESKLLSALTTIISIGLLGYGIYFGISSHKPLTGIIVSAIIIFLSGTMSGYYVVKQSKAGFMRFLGGAILQMGLPLFIIYKLSPQSHEILENWWVFYGICLVILILALVVSYSERFATILYTAALFISVTTVIYMISNYIGKGFWNGVGVILWALFISVLGVFTILVFYFTGEHKSAWGDVFGFITLLILPALGVFNSFKNPNSFWSGWWFVFLISFIIYSIYVFAFCEFDNL